MDRLSIDFDQLTSLIYLKGKQRGEEKPDQAGSRPRFLGVCPEIGICSTLCQCKIPKL